jgi:hypothetical protein
METDKDKFTPLKEDIYTIFCNTTEKLRTIKISKGILKNKDRVNMLKLSIRIYNFNLKENKLKKEKRKFNKCKFLKINIKAKLKKNNLKKNNKNIWTKILLSINNNILILETKEEWLNLSEYTTENHTKEYCLLQILIKLIIRTSKNQLVMFDSKLNPYKIIILKILNQII